MAPKKNIDWSGIHGEYRSGQLSIRAIGRLYHVTHRSIQKKAQAENWERDLTNLVRKRIANKLEGSGLVAAQVAMEIVEEVAERGFQVILAHRNDIRKLRELGAKILAELEEDKKYPVVVGKGKNQQVVQIGLSLLQKVKILRSLSQAAAKYIPLERQCFNLDNEKPPDPADGKQGFVYENLLAAIIFEERKITAGKKELTDGSSQGNNTAQKVNYAHVDQDKEVRR